MRNEWRSVHVLGTMPQMSCEGENDSTGRIISNAFKLVMSCEPVIRRLFIARYERGRRTVVLIIQGFVEKSAAVRRDKQEADQSQQILPSRDKYILPDLLQYWTEFLASFHFVEVIEKYCIIVIVRGLGEFPFYVPS